MKLTVVTIKEVVDRFYKRKRVRWTGKVVDAVKELKRGEALMVSLQGKSPATLTHAIYQARMDNVVKDFFSVYFDGGKAFVFRYIDFLIYASYVVEQGKKLPDGPWNMKDKRIQKILRDERKNLNE